MREFRLPGLINLTNLTEKPGYLMVSGFLMTGAGGVLRLPAGDEYSVSERHRRAAGDELSYKYGKTRRNLDYFIYFCINWKIMNLNAEVA